MDMKEIIYHSLGLCGEHWHPNFINLTLIAMVLSLLVTKLVKYRKKY